MAPCSIPLAIARPIRVEVVCEVGWGLALLPVPHITRLLRLLVDTKITDSNIFHILATLDLETNGRFRLEWSSHFPNRSPFISSFFSLTAVSYFLVPTSLLPVSPPWAPPTPLPANQRALLNAQYAALLPDSTNTN